MFEKEIEEYERVRANYQENIADRMSREQWMEYNEILFSAHSCAIEGNSFTVDDTFCSLHILAPSRETHLPLMIRAFSANRAWL